MREQGERRDLACARPEKWRRGYSVATWTWAACPLRRARLEFACLFRNLSGAPDTIRTCDLCLRRATLYPAELRVPARRRPRRGASTATALIADRPPPRNARVGIVAARARGRRCGSSGAEAVAAGVGVGRRGCAVAAAVAAPPARSTVAISRGEVAARAGGRCAVGPRLRTHSGLARTHPHPTHTPPTPHTAARPPRDTASRGAIVTLLP